MIFLIAALHALPIFVVAWMWSSKGLLWVVAAISAVVAVFWGSNAYLVADLLAIGGALWNCLEVLERRVPKELPVVAVAPVKAKDGSAASAWVVILMVGGWLAYVYVSPREPPLAQPAPIPRVAPVRAAAPDRPAVAPAPAPGVSATYQYREAPTIQKSPAPPTVKECLKVRSEKKMTRCLETAR